MIGLAMFILAIIFGAGLFFSWKFRQMVMESIAQGSSNLHERIKNKAGRAAEPVRTAGRGFLNSLRDWGALAAGADAAWQSWKARREGRKGFEDVENDLHNMEEQMNQRSTAVPPERRLGGDERKFLLGGSEGTALEMEEVAPGVWAYPSAARGSGDDRSAPGRDAREEGDAGPVVAAPWRDGANPAVGGAFQAVAGPGEWPPGADRADALLGGYGGRPAADDEGGPVLTSGSPETNMLEAQKDLSAGSSEGTYGPAEKGEDAKAGVGEHGAPGEAVEKVTERATAGSGSDKEPAGEQNRQAPFEVGTSGKTFVQNAVATWRMENPADTIAEAADKAAARRNGLADASKLAGEVRNGPVENPAERAAMPQSDGPSKAGQVAGQAAVASQRGPATRTTDKWAKHEAVVPDERHADSSAKKRNPFRKRDYPGVNPAKFSGFSPVNEDLPGKNPNS